MGGSGSVKEVGCVDGTSVGGGGVNTGTGGVVDVLLRLGVLCFGVWVPSEGD